MITRLCFLVLSSTFAVWMMTSVYGESAYGDEGRHQSPNQKRVDKETFKMEAQQNEAALQGATACGPAEFPDYFRNIDGTYNNCVHPEWGSAPIELLRLTTIDYGKDNTPSGKDRPNVREISNTVSHQGDRNITYYGTRKYSDYVWQWGQFLDHDIDLTPVTDDPLEPFDIPVPTGDPYFDPHRTGTQTIPLERSLYKEVNGVRQQVNHITAYIDASNVYGSDSARAEELRDPNNREYLKLDPQGFLPKNVNGLPNAPGGPNPDKFFLAGDFRANEQVGLTAMHTIFVREHNHWVDYFRNNDPDGELTDEELYQYARAMVGAEMQHITYNEFLPILLGRGALSPYKGYQPDVNPGISNVFATAAYRFGHSLVSSTLGLVNENGESHGGLPLRQAFFNPDWIQDNGIDDLLRGLAFQVAQRFDAYIVDDLRNHLFGEPGQGGFDLASLNLQRGRDHGLPGYNQVRQDFGLRPVKTFRQITRNVTIQRRLSQVYDNVNKVDMWIGGLAERPMGGGLVGPTVRAVLTDQFERLRDGDRFWYEIYLTPELLKLVKKQTLAEIIKRNTNIGDELGTKVFKVQ